jgi:hypothetical protein
MYGWIQDRFIQSGSSKLESKENKQRKYFWG